MSEQSIFIAANIPVHGDIQAGCKMQGIILCSSRKSSITAIGVGRQRHTHVVVLFCNTL